MTEPLTAEQIAELRDTYAGKVPGPPVTLRLLGKILATIDHMEAQHQSDIKRIAELEADIHSALNDSAFVIAEKDARITALEAVVEAAREWQRKVDIFVGAAPDVAMAFHLGPMTAAFEAFEDALAALPTPTASGRADARTGMTEETGWVIERGDSQTYAPTYWAGPDYWSQNNLDAVRFARKNDAEQVACKLGQGYHRVAEHAWIGPAAPTADSEGTDSVGTVTEAMRSINTQAINLDEPEGER